MKFISGLLSDKGLTKKAYLNALTVVLDYGASLIVGFLITPLMVAGVGKLFIRDVAGFESPDWIYHASQRPPWICPESDSCQPARPPLIMTKNAATLAVRSSSGYYSCRF